jgi:hypothetical protein
MKKTIVGCGAALLLIVGCGEAGGGDPGIADAVPPPDATAAGPAAATSRDDERHVFFGDLHVHTFYSFDAFIFGTRATPDDAYRYARGEPLSHPAGFEMRLDRPLDFYAVTDHAAFLGNLPAWADGRGSTADHPVAKRIREAVTSETATVAERAAAFQGMREFLGPGPDNELLDLGTVRSAWQDIREAADRHYDPGRFTTFVAYEYTSGPDSQNLHRNVIFRGSEAPAVPFSRLDAENPELLWDWMDAQRARGIESLAIPHNSNGSNGQMFALVDWAGDPRDDAYAERRMRNEPLVEITQVKGTSETHPLLSPNDEWANFEIMHTRVASTLPSEPSGSYAREALLNGLTLQATRGFNPYRFGFAGASDTHTGAASLDEDNYFSKVGLLDATPQLRGSVPMDQPDAEGNVYRDTYYDDWGASGLTGVWAERNDRGALYDAFRRKETFATSGPRIVLRMFAGFGWPDDLHTAADWVDTGYAGGTPMGGDLPPGDGAPRLVVQALQDPLGTPLQRLQIVKGWVADGEPREQVYDIACADGLSVDPATHRCPDNGATVDLTTCTISTDKGAAALATTWQDPDFDPHQHAFYYARALENPTCRWSTWDAIRAGVVPREDLQATIQERAWSSPVWYRGGAS